MEDGYISILQERLDNNADAIKAMESAHLAYAEERFALLSEEHLEFVKEMGWMDALKDRGDKCKCVNICFRP